ncbi:hypothetical protein [Rhodoplanes sp. Z2-YC6860]|uniref:hypothetical protein n=1 Tax=Rhodoplanes sp. Z2-YC6860 TaxID=674703 RepID=UPI00078CA745|nr:hypothetical protein RHPLAN_20350 [Rhodoplanes sp. Z2-YC6860]
MYGFLTSEPNTKVAAIHPKTMPVILRTLEEVDRWMNAPASDVPGLQQRLPDGALQIVASGKKQAALGYRAL